LPERLPSGFAHAPYARYFDNPSEKGACLYGTSWPGGSGLDSYSIQLHMPYNIDCQPDANCHNYRKWCGRALTSGCLASADGENGCAGARAVAHVAAAVDHAQTGTVLSRRRTAPVAV